DEGSLCEHAALLTCLQYGRTGSTLRIGKHAVLLDDQRPTQRDHHDRPQHTSEGSQDGYRKVVEVGVANTLTIRTSRKKEEARKRKDNTCGHRFACRPGSLNDVVLQYRCLEAL